MATVRKTSHFEFDGEGYEVDALHYLIKPVSYEKLSKVLDKAASRLEKEPDSLIIRSEGETFKILERDIFYIEAFLHSVSIYTLKKEYRVKSRFSKSPSAFQMTFTAHIAVILSR